MSRIMVPGGDPNSNKKSSSPSSRFVTSLSPEREKEFLKWYADVAKQFNQSDNPDDPQHYYDWRGYYDDLMKQGTIKRMLAMGEVARTGHFPDTWKTPGHPTFSVESKYYEDGMPAGHWEGDRFVLPMPEYDIFTDQRSYAARDAHRRSLDAFIRRNPQVAGLNTSEFADWMSAIAGLESSYRKGATTDASSYSGYYGLKGGANLSEEEQHRKAFEHLADLLKYTITTDDLRAGKERMFTPAQILYKYWNQGNHATEYLQNGIPYTEGKNVPIELAGNNINVDLDYSKYLRDAILDDYYEVQPGDTFDRIQARARHAGRHYDKAGKDLAPYNSADTLNGKLRVGDRIWFTKPYAYGGDLNRLRSLAERILSVGYEFGSGGKIHINPKNKGKFNALLKRTGKSASWFKEHGTPLQRKRATFALNAKHWNHKHADGGLVERYGADAVKEALHKRFAAGGDLDGEPEE